MRFLDDFANSDFVLCSFYLLLVYPLCLGLEKSRGVGGDFLRAPLDPMCNINMFTLFFRFSWPGWDDACGLAIDAINAINAQKSDVLKVGYRVSFTIAQYSCVCGFSRNYCKTKTAGRSSLPSACLCALLNAGQHLFSCVCTGAGC